MNLASEKCNAQKRWHMISQSKFHRVSILRGNAYGMREFMVLFVEPLIEWQVLVFAMEEPVHDVEAEILSEHADQ